MTSEEMIRSELLARFARLEAHLKLLNAEFREVKALLGAAQPASPPALIPAPPSASAVPAAASPSAPAPVAVNGVADACRLSRRVRLLTSAATGCA